MIPPAVYSLFVLLGWFSVCGVTDSINARALSHGAPPSWVTLSVMGMGTLSGILVLTAALWTSSIPLHSPKSLATLLVSAKETIQWCLSPSAVGLGLAASVASKGSRRTPPPPPSHVHWSFTAASPSRAVWVAAVANTAALYLMHAAFRFDGIAHAYPFKATEPLFTALFDFIINGRRHSFRTLVAICGIAAGAFLCGEGGVHGHTTPTTTSSSSGQFLQHVFSILCILISNALFALRTIFSKPLLQTRYYSPHELFAHISMLSLLMLTLPGLASLVPLLQSTDFVLFNLSSPSSASPRPEVLISSASFIAGACYFLYHWLGNVVLLWFHPVSYAVCKQLRILAVLLWALAAFPDTYGSLSVGSLVAGATLLLAGTALYALLDHHGPPQPKEAPAPVINSNSSSV